MILRRLFVYSFEVSTCTRRRGGVADALKNSAGQSESRDCPAPPREPPTRTRPVARDVNRPGEKRHALLSSRESAFSARSNKIMMSPPHTHTHVSLAVCASTTAAAPTILVVGPRVHIIVSSLNLGAIRISGERRGLACRLPRDDIVRPMSPSSSSSRACERTPWRFNTH